MNRKGMSVILLMLRKSLAILIEFTAAYSS